MRPALRFLGCVLLALATWGFVPRPKLDAELSAPVRVVVVDASASALRSQRAWLPWVRDLLREEALLADARGERFALVSFARDVGVVFTPGAPQKFLERLRGLHGAPLDPRTSAGAGDASHLKQALGLAAVLSMDPGAELGSVVLVGCDGYTGEAPSQALARIKLSGVSLEHRPLPASHWHELALLKLRMQPRLEPGAPLLALAELNYRRGLASLEGAWLSVEIRNGLELSSKRIELKLPPLGGRFEVPIACGPAGPGRTEVELRLHLAPEPGDPMPENDSLMGVSFASGSRVILVAVLEDRLQLARAWLTATGGSNLPGIQFVFVEPKQLPQALLDADALVSFDVPIDQLPGTLIKEFVKRGGGLLVTGGWRFLGSWFHGQPAGPLVDLLPARPKARNPEPRDVVLLVDGSGSMSGEPFETVRSACLDLVGNAAPEDRVVLQFFTIGLHPENVIKQRLTQGQRPSSKSAEEAARQLLRLHVPEGSTHIVESIETFEKHARSKNTETLLFVLTDGIELETFEDLDGRLERLHSNLTEAKIEIVPIAIGARPNMDFLQRLTRPGEDVTRPAGLEDLRELFRREISGARVRSAKDAPLELAWATGAAGDLVRELRGIEPAGLTSIQRLIRNELKPWGQALWLADEGEPVLSVGLAGLGRVALLSSVPRAGWGPGWVGRAGFGEPAEFENVLRWLARSPQQARSAIELDQAGRQLELRGLDASWPASFEASVVDAIASAQVEFMRLEFRPLGRGNSIDFMRRRRAQLEGNLDALKAGAPVLRLEHPDGKLEYLPLEPPRSAEFVDQAPLDPSWFEAPRFEPKKAPSAFRMGTNPWAPSFLAWGLIALFLGFVRISR
jgi:hypothetical protein